MRTSTRLHHPFRLPSLHRLNTKDLAAPPTVLGSSSNHRTAAYRSGLTTPPPRTTTAAANPITAVSPSSTTSTLSPSSITSSNASSALSSSHAHLRHLLLLRRKQSRIDGEREMADERARFGGPDGGPDLLDVMEPRPAFGDRSGGGGIVMGGIFEVLEA